MACKVDNGWAVRLESSRIVMPSKMSTVLWSRDLVGGGTYGDSTGGWLGLFTNFSFLGAFKPTSLAESVVVT